MDPSHEYWIIFTYMAIQCTCIFLYYNVNYTRKILHKIIITLLTFPSYFSKRKLKIYNLQAAWRKIVDYCRVVLVLWLYVKSFSKYEQCILHKHTAYEVKVRVWTRMYIVGQYQESIGCIFLFVKLSFWTSTQSFDKAMFICKGISIKGCSNNIRVRHKYV